jgi:hypothetical protein
MRRMPIGSAVHERTFPLCESLNFREWSGYYAVMTRGRIAGVPVEHLKDRLHRRSGLRDLDAVGSRH